MLAGSGDAVDRAQAAWSMTILSMTLTARICPRIRFPHTKLWLECLTQILLWGLLIPVGFVVLAGLYPCGPCTSARAAKAPGFCSGCPYAGGLGAEPAFSLPSPPLRPLP